MNINPTEDDEAYSYEEECVIFEDIHLISIPQGTISSHAPKAEDENIYEDVENQNGIANTLYPFHFGECGSPTDLSVINIHPPTATPPQKKEDLYLHYESTLIAAQSHPLIVTLGETAQLQPQEGNKNVVIQLCQDVDQQKVPIQDPMSFDHRAMVKGDFEAQYKLGKHLGTGGFGEVFFAHDRTTNETVVVKFFRKDSIFEEGYEPQAEDPEANIPPEVVTLNNLYGVEGVVQLVNYMENEEFGQLIMEPFGDAIDLKQLVEETPDGLPEETAKLPFFSLCKTVSNLHKNGYLHMDIKPSNALFNKKTRRLQMIDFGSAYPLPEEPFIGYYSTLQFTAPEALMEEEIMGPEQEIWALGSTLYFMLEKKHLYNTHEEIICGVDHDFSPNYSDDLRELLNGMLDRNVESRWTMDKILASPWFQHHAP